MKRHAIQIGVAQAEITEADDAENPREYVMNLILAKKGGNAAVASPTITARGVGKKIARDPSETALPMSAAKRTSVSATYDTVIESTLPGKNSPGAPRKKIKKDQSVIASKNTVAPVAKGNNADK